MHPSVCSFPHQVPYLCYPSVKSVLFSSSLPQFFQQKDTFKQDALFLGGVLLLFYTLTKAWGSLFSGTSGF